MSEMPDRQDFGDRVVRLPAPRAPDLPPVSVETEAALIGCILLKPPILPTVQHLVAVEHFFEPAHQTIWETILAISEAGDTPDLLKVKAVIGPKMLQHDLGGLSVMKYLTRLSTDGCVPASAPEYARTIQQYWQLRELALATIDVREGNSFVPGPALERIYSRVDQVRASFVARKVTTASLDQAGDELIGEIQAGLQGSSRELPSCGLSSLDGQIGGAPQPSNLITCAARTSMGKSALGTEWADATAAQGHAAIYHSLEMDRRQITARVIASALERRRIRLPYGLILKRGGLNYRQAEMVVSARMDMRGRPLTIEDGGGRTIGEIAAASDRIANQYAKRGVPLGVIVIDHAHIVRPARAYRREDEGLKEVADGALALAKHLSCPVVLLAQCNRGPEGREDKRPGLADIRGGGAFEENSDTVLFLYRPGYYAQRTAKYRDGDPSAHDAYEEVRHVLEIIIDKNRAGGPNQVVRAWMDESLNAIRDYGGVYT